MTTATGIGAPARVRPVGLIVMCAAVVILSVSSTLVKKSGAPGPTIAFWRTTGAAAVWTAILWGRERRFVRIDEIRRALLPGIAFGLNITVFFTAVTHTTVANAEFIGTLTPIVLVPAGAIIFHEQINAKALAFGAVSIVGLTMVLFLGPANGEASWFGNALAFGSMITWCTYLISSRGLRATTSVAGILGAAMPISALTILPIALATGDAAKVTWSAAGYIAILVILSGTVAHGMIMFAQRSVPVGTIGLIQIAQPAMAALWSVALLSTSIRGAQVIGMVLVLAGLAAMLTVRQRTRP